MSRETEDFSSLSERRACARYTLETNRVSFDTGSGDAGSDKSSGLVLNFSEDGMAVYTKAQVKPGSTVRLRWDLPQNAESLETEGPVFFADKESGQYRVEFRNRSQQVEEIETEGVVVWVDRDSECFGVKFHNLSDQVRKSILSFGLPRLISSDSAPAEPSREAFPAKPGRDLFTRRTMANSRALAEAPAGAKIVSPEQKVVSTAQKPSVKPSVPAIASAPAPAAPAPRARRTWSSVAAIVALVCAIFLGIGAYWGAHAKNAGGLGFMNGSFMNGSFLSGSFASGGTGTVASAPMFRLAGSNTIGSTLGPALAQAFLKHLGATDTRIVPGDRSGETTVQAVLPGFLPGDSSQVEIQITAHGTATAFDGLKNASCDIGMASRKIKPAELSMLSSLGDFSSPASEHLLGLDGIAVIVSSSNPVQMLTKDQLAGIFSGTIEDWSQVSSQHGIINVYASDNRSGTYDTFKTLVLGGKRLAGNAKRLEDSRALSDAVAADHNGIGFIGLPFVLNAKAIAVAERGATPFQPNRLTVGTEDYLLSRRLYLYTPANSQNKYVRKFVEFALSKAGQEVVGDTGFVAQNVTAENDLVSPDAPPEYRRLTQGAGRLSLDFRFLPGLTVLDSKSMADLDRVVSFLADSGYSGNDLMLLGFTDNTGDRQVNILVSQTRAKMVAQQFQQRGLKPAMVKGFGPDLPISSNDTDFGRERNRRVEIWLKQAQCVAPPARNPG
jgi:phosphate transport system substrate-binding protein